VLKIGVPADFQLRSFAVGKTPAKTEGFCWETPPSVAAKATGFFGAFADFGS